MEKRCFFSIFAPGADEAAVKVDFDDQALEVHQDSINNGDPEDFYTFKLKHASTVDIRLRGMEQNGDVEVLNANGKRVMAATHEGDHDERLSRELAKGRYFIRVFQGRHNASTPYNLRVTGDLNWGQVEENGERRDIGVRYLVSETRPIRDDRNTFVLIHDWDEDAHSMHHLGRALNFHRFGDQVLVLDWSDAASGADNVADAKQWIDQSGKFLADKLTRFGLETDQVVLVGHGLGAYVAAEAAEHFDRGVNGLVALDPTKGVSNYTFRWRTRASMSLVASNLASDKNAKTADATFEVNLRDHDGDAEDVHDDVVDLYASMVTSAAFGIGDRISRVFDITQLRANGNRPWDVNAYDGYEGELHARLVNRHWAPDVLEYERKGDDVAIEL